MTLRSTVGRGHLAGIAASFGFDYMEVTSIEMTAKDVTVNHYDRATDTLCTTVIPVERLHS